MENKLLIVVYAGIKGIDPIDSAEYLDDIARYLDSSSWNDECRFMLIPQRGTEDVKVECINPVLLTEEKYKEAEDTVSKLKEALKEFKKDEK